MNFTSIYIYLYTHTHKPLNLTWKRKLLHAASILFHSEEYYNELHNHQD